MPNQTFIVADAGGTSTQWRIVQDGRIAQYETIGFNAYTHSIDDLKRNISETFRAEIEHDSPVFFYAAGIDTKNQSEEVKESLTELFGENVRTFNDLMGVARSLCGIESGNVCILGTGANACYYNGKEVNKVGASLGYILGDEGSGAYLGKKLLQGIFRGQLNPEIIAAFQGQFNITSHEVIERLYNQPKPNHYLASFAPFVFEHRHQPEIHRLIEKTFHDFFDAFHPVSNEKEPFHFSGSIAWKFSDLLRQVGTERGFTIKNIVQSPISGLVLYHQNYD